MYSIVNYVFQPNSERHFFHHIQKHSEGIEGIAILT